MRKGLEPEWNGVLEHLGKDAGQSPGASRSRRGPQAEQVVADDPANVAQAALRQLLQSQTSLTPMADPPPLLTCATCQGGPECVHEAGRYVCACEWPAEQEPSPHTCLQSMGDQVRNHQTVVDEMGWKAVTYDRCQPGSLCALCEWEQAALRWAWVRADAKIERLRRERSHAFYTADQAITAYAGFGGVSRAPSSMKTLISKLEHGQVAPVVKQQATVPILERLDDIIAVEKAVKRAYKHAYSEWFLESDKCESVLVDRVLGVPEDHLAQRFAVSRKFVKSLVRAGRRRVAVELAAREVIPMPPRAAKLHAEIDARRREILK